MVKVIYIDGKYSEKIRINKQAIDYLKKNKIKFVALFASVQFLDLEKVKEQLKEIGIRAIITKPRMANKESQILGCDIYPDCFNQKDIENCNAIFYIGDGHFHPTALVFAFKKTILIYNPISDNFKILTKKDIEKNIQKIKTNIKKFISAEKIGILVSTKPGQQQLKLAKILKEKLKKEDKKAFIFIDNNFKLSNLENFNFIECWVNTACPRIGTDDILNISKPVINIKEAFNPAKALESL